MMDDNIKFVLGRGVSDDTLHVRRKVFNFLKLKEAEAIQKYSNRDDAENGEREKTKLTVPDIADALTLECDDVRRAMKFFQKKMMVKERKEHRQTSLQGGRPAAVWEIISLNVV